MGHIEDVGEAILTFISRTIYHTIGFLIWMLKFLRPLERNIKIYPYFEKRNIELKDYVVLKAQTATLIFLMSSVVFVFGFLSFKNLAFLFIVFGAYSLHITLVQLKEHFSGDYPAYKMFFLSYLAISVLLVVVKLAKPTVKIVFPLFHLLLLSMVFVGAVSFLFKRKFGRTYTLGRVLKSGDEIVVKVNYDLRSGVKPGVHTFENKLKAKEGDHVKLLVESSRFNLRGSRVVGLMPVE
ncbi:MAG: DUF2101 family protein [Candidatus Hydrothermarchaeaceae archaeon]